MHLPLQEYEKVELFLLVPTCHMHAHTDLFSDIRYKAVYSRFVYLYYQKGILFHVLGLLSLLNLRLWDFLSCPYYSSLFLVCLVHIMSAFPHLV